MNPVPLDQIGFNWISHKSALWWLGLIYCRPAKVKEEIKSVTLIKRLKLGPSLWIHILPYIITICALGRFIIFDLLALHHDPRAPYSANVLNFHLFHITMGIAWGIAIGVAVGSIAGIVGGMSFGITYGLALGILFGIESGGTAGIISGIVSGIALGIAFRTAFGVAGGIAFGMAFGAIFRSVLGNEGVIAYGIASIVCLLRLYYYPIHVVFVWPKTRPRLYSYHPVAWDDLCFVPLGGLHKLLVSLAETQTDRGEAEIENLIANYSTQRLEALRAKAILLARK